MNNIVTLSGRQHRLDGPGVSAPGNAPSIREIGYSLAQINRFTGHCIRPNSVAEHSLLVAEIARTVFQAPVCVQYACLMHDAHECITGDVASPVKCVLGAVWHAFEDLQQSNLLRHFGLTETFRQHHALIKQCDLMALATERRDLMRYNPASNDPWPVLDTPGQIVPASSINLNSLERNTRGWETWARIFISNVTLLAHRASKSHELTLA